MKKIFINIILILIIFTLLMKGLTATAINISIISMCYFAYKQLLLPSILYAIILCGIGISMIL